MENSLIDSVSDTFNSSVLQQNPNANVEQTERIISIGTGAFIALKGITNVFSHPFLALVELGVGGALLYRGLTGYCPMKEKLEDQVSSSNLSSSESLGSPAAGIDPLPTTALPTESY